MDISSWLKGLAGLAVGAALVCNLPTKLWMSAERATVEYLADTSLQTLDEAQRQFKVVTIRAGVKLVDEFNSESSNLLIHS